MPAQHNRAAQARGEKAEGESRGQGHGQSAQTACRKCSMAHHDVCFLRGKRGGVGGREGRRRGGALGCAAACAAPPLDRRARRRGRLQRCHVAAAYAQRCKRRKRARATLPRLHVPTRRSAALLRSGAVLARRAGPHKQAQAPHLCVQGSQPGITLWGPPAQAKREKDYRCLRAHTAQARSRAPSRPRAQQAAWHRRRPRWQGVWEHAKG